MTSISPGPFRRWLMLTTLFCSWLICAGVPNSLAEPVPVRHLEGNIRGFLVLRSEDGRELAAGDMVRVAHGDRVTVHVIFRFKDGSIDEETTVFSQRGNFKLISDRHIQKGPSFAHPMDVSVDCPSGLVTVRTVGKDGKQEGKAVQVDLPPDLANGMVPALPENIPSGGAQTTDSMLVATPKPRVVKLVVSSQGESPFSVAASAHRALRYDIRVELGGVAGVVAPLIGKQPPDIEAWIVGSAPTFIREKGPMYPDGPVTTIELASPVFADATKTSR